MKKVFLFVVLVMNMAIVFAQSTEDKLWTRVEALTKAIFETKDSVALYDLVGEGVTYGHSGGNIENKSVMITKAVASPTTYKNRVFEKISIDIDGKTAVLRHNFRAISVEQGKEAPLDLAILQVWKKKKREMADLGEAGCKNSC